MIPKGSIKELKQISKINYYEERNIHPIKTTLFIITAVLTTLYGLLKGSSTTKSIANLDKCDPIQIVILVILTISVGLIQIYSVIIVMKEQKLKLKYNCHEEHEIKYTLKKCLMLVSVSFIIGILANILGVGGGFVIFPLIILFGGSPLVSAACTMFLIFLSKMVATFFAFISGYVIYSYTIFFTVMVMLSVIFFIIVMNNVLKKFKRQSIIILSMIFVLIVCFGVLPPFTIKMSNETPGFWKFQSYCQSS